MVWQYGKIRQSGGGGKDPQQLEFTGPERRGRPKYGENSTKRGRGYIKIVRSMSGKPNSAGTDDQDEGKLKGPHGWRTRVSACVGCSLDILNRNVPVQGEG